MPIMLIGLQRSDPPAPRNAIIARGDGARGQAQRGLAGRAAADIGLRVDV